MKKGHGQHYHNTPEQVAVLVHGFAPCSKAMREETRRIPSLTLHFSCSRFLAPYLQRSASLR